MSKHLHQEALNGPFLKVCCLSCPPGESLGLLLQATSPLSLSLRNAYAYLPGLESEDLLQVESRRSWKSTAQPVFGRVENEFSVVAATFGTLIHSILSCPGFLASRAWSKAHLFQQAFPD